MSDADNRATCGNCGLPILDGEAADWTPFPPRRLCHARHADCFARLRAEIAGVNDDLAAALRVVRAARVLRVRRRQVNRRMSDYHREVRACGSADAAALVADIAYNDWRAAESAYDAALTAYVKGGAR